MAKSAPVPEVELEEEEEETNVVAMPGYAIPTPQGKPVPEMVAMLQELLGLAEAGQLHAVAVSYVIDDNTSVGVNAFDYKWEANKFPFLYNAICRMKRDIERSYDEGN
jgi:hypothetical protein